MAKHLSAVGLLSFLMVFQVFWNTAAAFCLHENDTQQARHIGHHQVAQHEQQYSHAASAHLDLISDNHTPHDTDHDVAQALANLQENAQENPQEQPQKNLQHDAIQSKSNADSQTSAFSMDHCHHLPAFHQIALIAKRIAVERPVFYSMLLPPHWIWFNDYQSVIPQPLTPPPTLTSL